MDHINSTTWIVRVAILSVTLWIYPNGLAHAQTLGDAKAAIRFGEFPRAITYAESAPKPESDELWSGLALEQSRSGASQAMWNSSSRITNDVQRTSVLNSLFQNVRDENPSQQGGITIQDFQPLINLIQTTVAPDSWSTTQGEGTIQPYLSGVYVDAAGAVHRFVPDSSGLLNSIGKNKKNIDQVSPTELRRVSLIQLEKQAQQMAMRGQPLTEEIVNLAGIYDLQYLIFDKENQDILIAGPAGPWHKTLEGVTVNNKTGRPVLQLDDLVSCLRAVWFDGGRFGCTITPREENFAAAQEFLRTTKLRGDEFNRQLREKVGLQDVEVFGIARDSTTAQVLVEADYRMKLLGMGIEPSIADVPNYFQRAFQQPEPLQPIDVARWWFTLNYDGIATNDDKTVFEFIGTGVKVLSESEMLDEHGKRIHTHTSKGPTKSFAEDFSRHFDKIAAKYPVYDQLRNIFDLALVCSIIKKEDIAGQANWNLTYFGRPNSKVSFCHELRHVHVAQVVESVMNYHVESIREGSKKVIKTSVGVSGGIDCPINEMVRSAKYSPMATGNSIFPKQESKPASGWWWD